MKGNSYSVMEQIRVILADDHWLVREGTRHILEQCSNLKIVGDAEDGQQALELIERLQPDVAILDIRMPKLNGIEVVQQMKKQASNTRALVLTAFDDDDYILALMAAGADGYLLKTARPSELIDAIERVHLGESVLHPAIATKVARLWVRLREVTGDRPIQLSSREREILQLAANGLRNRVIADKLSISVRTVEGHFNSIFAKFGVSSRIEAVLFAISRHLVDLGEENSL
ncbi:MAG: LuxR family transcriptional regulator [Dehalococcoidales bacterium]|nr:LuxR family transcriptional regulator [Dehalococcoidales bacterium]